MTTAAAITTTTTATAPARTGGLLLVGFAAAVAVRVGAGSPHPAGSTTAGLLFAGCLAALCWAANEGVRARGRHVLTWGTLGALLLCAPVVMSLRTSASTRGFLPWAAAVTVVVVAEEAFLRGVLFSAITKAAGGSVAVLVTSVAFAGLHVPLYGWRVVPLDFAVGLLLGALRLASGSWVAPAIAHTVADYVGWFVR